MCINSTILTHTNTSYVRHKHLFNKSSNFENTLKSYMQPFSIIAHQNNYTCIQVINISGGIRDSLKVPLSRQASNIKTSRYTRIFRLSRWWRSIWLTSHNLFNHSHSTSKQLHLRISNPHYRDIEIVRKCSYLVKLST
jgi:hypothetical protein